MAANGVKETKNMQPKNHLDALQLDKGIVIATAINDLLRSITTGKIGPRRLIGAK